MNRKDDELQAEAMAYHQHAEAVRNAKDFDELKRLLSEFFQHRADELRDKWLRRNEPTMD